MNFKERYDISFEDYINYFRTLIKKLALKNSYQRELVIKAIFFSSKHLGAEEIQAIINNEYKANISLSSIYKILSFLEEKKIVIEQDFNFGSKKYELSISKHHDHMICTKCKKILEFYNEDLEKLQNKIAKDMNFKIKSHIMTIYGTCENCT